MQPHPSAVLIMPEARLIAIDSYPSGDLSCGRTNAMEDRVHDRQQDHREDGRVGFACSRLILDFLEGEECEAA